MTAGLFTLKSALRWVRSSSLWYVTTGAGCCADEIMMAMGCRYDLERFGCVHEVDAGKADLLIVNGVVTRKSAPALRAMYDKMVAPKYVMALGACACTGGPFSPELSYATVGGVEKVIPVDVFVPGCPPRPEAIMNGLINLQEKIRGSGVSEIAH
jgi:NADH-quinone oxidoreductase subunit B